MIATLKHSDAYVTVEQFKAMPEGRPYFELENGALVPMPSPTPRHQDVNLVLAAFLRDHVRTKKLGRIFLCPNVLLPDDKAYIPDIAFLTEAGMSIFDPASGWIEGTPQLVVEITSANASRDRIAKFKAYFENGVNWYWIVDPDTLGVEEYRQTPDGYVRSAGAMAGEVFAPRAFEGMNLNLADLMGETVKPDNA